MSATGYKILHQSEPHFITFATVGWLDIFTRPLYTDILFDSIRFCQNKKGMSLHGWCLMTNHIHLLMSSKKNDLSGLLRDFKKHTSKTIIDAILYNQRESRKEWIIPLLKKFGEENSRNESYQLWQQDNHPKHCFSPAFTLQKLNYIHQNPVKAGIVDRAEDYRYSSARDYVDMTKCGLLGVDFV